MLRQKIGEHVLDAIALRIARGLQLSASLAMPRWSFWTAVAASARASARVSGRPIASTLGSDWSSGGATGPSVSFFFRPRPVLSRSTGERNRTAQDFAPSGCSTR
jgi:hypothetical protein